MNKNRIFSFLPYMIMHKRTFVWRNLCIVNIIPEHAAAITVIHMQKRKSSDVFT